jgi:hypothetical protein
MEQQSELAEEKTTYELEKDKRVVELAKKLLPVKEATDQLWVHPFIATGSSSAIGEFLLFS